MSVHAHNGTILVYVIARYCDDTLTLCDFFHRIHVCCVVKVIPALQY